MLYFGDCVEVMSDFPDAGFDMVLTSPPYNVGVDYANKGEADDKKSIEEYISLANRTMAQVFRVLVDGGRACFELGGSATDFPLTYIWQRAAYENGLHLYSEIGLQHRKTNQTAWGSWLKADNVRVVPNFHMLYVFYKTHRKKNGENTYISSGEFVEWTKGYWIINWSDAPHDHPATFPVELPMRCMKLFGHVGDKVLDPFMGSGTTGIACLQNERDFTGIELEKVYFDMAVRRIEAEKQKVRLF